MAEIDKGKILKDAFEYQRKGQHDRAIDELRKILKVHPRDTRTLQKIAELQSKKGDRQEAVKTYTQLAEVYEKDGFVDFAISVYKTILKMNDKLFDVHLRLGKLSLKKNLKGEAIASFQTAFKLCSDSNKRERAEILEKMIEANPEDVSAIDRLADHYYYDEGKADPAKDILRKGADVMKNALNPDRARKFYEKILKIDSKDEFALKAIAEIEANAGKPKAAADIYEKILESNPSDVEALKKAAELYQSMGDMEGAKACLRRLAGVYKLANSDADLSEVYEKILSLDPSDSESVEFVDRRNKASEIKIDEPSQEESELKIESDPVELKTETIPLSDHPHSSGQEHREENDEKLEIVIDSESGYTGPKDSLNPPIGRLSAFSQTGLDKKTAFEFKTVGEKELKKTRVELEEESNVVDINRESYKKGEKTATEDTISFRKESAENLNKGLNSAFYERGIAYKDMRMTEQAVDEFRKSIGEGYRVPESYMMIGLCLIQRGDGKRALRWFQKGLSLDGLAVEQVISLKSGSALTLGVMGNVSDAIKLLEEIIEDYQWKE